MHHVKYHSAFCPTPAVGGKKFQRTKDMLPPIQYSETGYAAKGGGDCVVSQDNIGRLVSLPGFLASGYYVIIEPSYLWASIIPYSTSCVPF